MAIEIIENQPIKFERLGVPDPTCEPCTDEFCLPVRPGDYTQFQFKITPCSDSENLFINPGFDSSPATWVSPDNTFENDIDEQNVGIVNIDNNLESTFTQSNIFEVGCYYGISIDLKIFGGDAELWLTSFGESRFRHGVQIYEAPSLSFQNGRITLEFYGFAEITDFILSYRASVMDSRFMFDNFTVRKIDLDYSVAICDEDNQVVKRFDIGEDLITETESDFVKLTRDRVTVTVDWSAEPIPFGCYCVCLYDPCAVDAQDFNNLINHGFDNAYGWTISGGGTSFIRPGELVMQGFKKGATICNDFVTQVGVDYDFSIEISIPVACAHQIELTIMGQDVVVNPTGIYTGTITGDGSVFCVSFDTLFIDTTGLCTNEYGIGITDISISEAGADQIPDYKSNCFSLQQNRCSMLIEACNDYKAFDLMPEENFVLNVRVEGYLKNPTYGYESTPKLDSKGRQINSYFSRQKYQQLVIEFQPEFVLDFLSLLAGFNHFYINGEEYVVKIGEEFIPIYNSSLDNRARVSILVRKKVENVKNVLCESENLVGCVPRQIINGIVEEDCELPSIGAVDGSWSLANPSTGALIDQL